MQKKRLIFMGTPDFAASSLQALLNQDDCELVAVYSQPPRPAGRGKKEQKSPVHILAEKNNIDVFTPISLKNNEQEQSRFAAFENIDFIIVAAYGLLLPDYIIDGFKCLNIHASLLPRWRGAAPIQRAIGAGDKETGITIMHMDAGLDTGDMLLKKTIAITDFATAGSLHDELSDLGADAIIEAINSTLVPQKQGEGATYAKKIRKEEAQIDWNQDGASICRQIRAFNPFPGAYYDYNGEKIKILKASFEPQNHNQEAGKIIDNKFSISCKDGIIKPLIVQRPGKKSMAIEDMLRGFKF